MSHLKIPKKVVIRGFAWIEEGNLGPDAPDAGMAPSRTTFTAAGIRDN